MLQSRISRLFLLLGAAVGLMSVVVWTLELRINLPDWMIRVAMLKLAFLASAGLLAAGAILGRRAKANDLSALDSGPSSSRLAEGPARPLRKTEAGAAERVERRRSDSGL
jgi:hypothetical protein